MAAIVGRKGTATAFLGENAELTAEDRLKNVTTFNLPQSETDEIDVTDFDSEGNETEAGSIDYGEFSVTQHLVDGEQYDKVMGLQESGKHVHFQAFVHKSDGSIAVGRKGEGVITGVSLEGVERGSAFTFTTTVKVSGKTSKVETEPGAE